MAVEVTHNPDRFISDLRLILSQGRKRIGLLIGAGAPASIKIDSTGGISESGRPLIPTITGLTDAVVGSLAGPAKHAVDLILTEFTETPNVEDILSRVRLLAKALGSGALYELSGNEYEALGQSLCERIGTIVNSTLPAGPNPYSELMGWISGTVRPWPIELFTTNYDLLFEEAFERAKVPYFDGFSGGHAPFFDPSSVAANDMPSRWGRLWKLHGSLGWALEDDTIVRGRGRTATSLIYPDHLKYDQIRKLPYSAFFERLRRFLLTPDSLMITCGFSFSDAHVSAVLDEALATNGNTAIFAFQFNELNREKSACLMGYSRPNFSVYATDGAVIRGVAGRWQLGDPPNKDWADIRRTFWGARVPGTNAIFTLGDFQAFCRFVALSQATQVVEPAPVAPAPAASLSTASSAVQ